VLRNHDRLSDAVGDHLSSVHAITDGITSYLISYELTDKNVFLSFVKIELQVMYEKWFTQSMRNQ